MTLNVVNLIKMPSGGDARIEFEEEVTPGKDLIKGTAKTFIPFIVLFLTKENTFYIKHICNM